MDERAVHGFWPATPKPSPRFLASTTTATIPPSAALPSLPWPTSITPAASSPTAHRHLLRPCAKSPGYAPQPPSCPASPNRSHPPFLPRTSRWSKATPRGQRRLAHNHSRGCGVDVVHQRCFHKSQDEARHRLPVAHLLGSAPSCAMPGSWFTISNFVHPPYPISLLFLDCRRHPCRLYSRPGPDFASTSALAPVRLEVPTYRISFPGHSSWPAFWSTRRMGKVRQTWSRHRTARRHGDRS